MDNPPDSFGIVNYRPPSPPHSTPSPPAAASTNIGLIVGVITGVVSVAVLAVVLFILYRRRRLAKKQRESGDFSANAANVATSSSLISRPPEYSYLLSFSEIEVSTNYFDEALVIGVGGFGKVYRGELSDGRKVAVKRGSQTSHQGIEEFKAEIQTLTKYHHGNLVSLIGYCDQNHELILVYEYVEKGTLRSHLYGSGLPTLTWKERLIVCIGAAKGLHYLHTAFATPLIHRDVKSFNILLDGNLHAKVGDFGIARIGPNADESHVSTGVKGTFGYLDPEYFMLEQLTGKSDFYSFGVVLLEILCARPVMDPSLPRNVMNLKDWVLKSLPKGELDRIIDPELNIGEINPDSLKRFMETAESCLVDCGDDRPSMRDIMLNLESALQFQQPLVQSQAAEENSSDEIVEIAPQDANVSSSSAANVEDSADFSLTRVFSQLVKSD